MNGKQARRFRALSKGDGPRNYGGKLYKYTVHAVNMRTGEMRFLKELDAATPTKNLQAEADKLAEKLEVNSIDGKPLESLWVKAHMTLKTSCERHAYKALKREHTAKS